MENKAKNFEESKQAPELKNIFLAATLEDGKLYAHLREVNGESKAIYKRALVQILNVVSMEIKVSMLDILSGIVEEAALIEFENLKES